MKPRTKDELGKAYQNKIANEAVAHEDKARELMSEIGVDTETLHNEPIVNGEPATYSTHTRLWMIAVCKGELAEAVVLGHLIFRSNPYRGQAVRDKGDGNWWIWKGRKALAKELMTTESRCRTALNGLIEKGLIIAREDNNYVRQIRVNWELIKKLRKDLGC